MHPDCTVVIPLPSTALDASPYITLRLHTECLSSKSLFFKSLFNGVSPIDLIQSISTSRLNPSVPLHVPPSRLPRLLPSPSSHPTVLLPVPDPSSIQILFEWMYLGNTDHLQKALDQGDIQWQGLARNVEYLGLSTDIKVFLGRWYRNSPEPCPPTDYDEESDWDSEDDDDEYLSPSDEDEMDTDECSRGRSHNIKCLFDLPVRALW